MVGPGVGDDEIVIMIRSSSMACTHLYIMCFYVPDIFSCHLPF